MKSLLASTALLAAGLATTAALAQSSTMPTSADAKMTATDPAMAGKAKGEAKALLERQAEGTGRKPYSPETAVKFKPSDNVFLRSALEVDFTYRNATVTLPLFKGMSPMGEPVYYIVTEASDFDVAKQMGLNFSPKMKHAAGTPGAQKVTVDDGVIKFKGDVDFAPKHTVVAGSPMPFPPKVAKPGAMADLEWSSAVEMPSGVVFNIQMVHNATGNHDRVKDIDLKKQTITLSLLDGFQGGKQYYYHLVTDVSADLPAVLEKGVYAPKLALLPELGKSKPSDKSALLGFSPVLNGMTDMESKQDQGFTTTLANGGIDPINIFPIDPDNDNASETNNYSPMWDAHVNMWTEAAIKDKKVRRITSFEDLKSLIEAGLVTSAMISPAGPGNEFMFGLRPTNAVVNCPVIAQPDLPPN
jgi:hypothetical protein